MKHSVKNGAKHTAANIGEDIAEHNSEDNSEDNAGNSAARIRIGRGTSVYSNVAAPGMPQMPASYRQ